MKKTRVLALLLCVMMVMTVLPAWQVSAEVTTYDTIDDIVGVAVAASKTYSFTAANAETLYGTSGCGCDFSETSFDAENGLTLAGTAPRWRFGGNNSSSLGSEKAIYFRAKVDTGKSATLYFHIPDTSADQDAYEFTITPEAVQKAAWTAATQMTPFVPGTGFVEYLVVDKEDGNGLNVYAKIADQYEGKWVCVLNVPAPNGNLSSTSEVYFSGQCSVQEVVLYSKAPDSFDGVDQIMGKTMYAEKTFDMTNKDYQSESGFIFKPQGDHTAENGATIYNNDGGNGFWRYNSGTASWSPLTVGSRAAYFQAKVTEGQMLEIMVQSPAGGTEYGSFQISPTAFAENNFTKLDFARDGGAGTGFVEYLLVAETETKINLYAKGLTGDGKWILAATASGFAKNDNANMGLYFAGNGYVKKVILYTDTEPEGGGGTTPGTPDGTTSFDTIEEIAGVETLYTYKEFNFTSATAQNDYSGSAYDQAETSFDTTNGMTLSGSAPRWRYWEKDSWSAIDEGRLVYFQAKVSTDATMPIYFKKPCNLEAGNEQTYLVTLADDGVTSNASAQLFNSFVPGTEWAEYVVLATETGMMLYAKKGDSQWKPVLFATETMAISKNSAVYFTGQGAVKKAVIYTPTQPGGTGGDGGEGGGGTTPPVVVPPSSDSHDSIKAVTGRNMTLDIGFDMRKDNFTSGGASYMLTAQLTYDASNGMGINGGYWRYTPINYYMPITVGDKVAFFRGKVANTSGEYGVLFQGPAGGKARSYIGIKSNGIRVAEGAMHYKNASFTPGTDWTDYLLVADTEESWTMYALNASTGYKWTAVLQGGYGNGGGPSTGLYFTGTGYIKEAGIYKNGASDEAGATFTPVELFGDNILEENKKLTLDSSFDGALENAGAKNVSTGADLTPYTIGENGLELKNTGANEYFAWNYGTTNSWMPLGTRTPVLFRAKMESGAELGVQVGGGEAAKILLTPSGAKVDGVLGMTSNYELGTDWVNYLMMTDGATVKLYARGDNETNWTLVATPERFSLGGYYGILLSNTKSATTYVSSVEQARFARPTLTDRDKIYELNGKIYLDETEPATTVDMTEVDPRGTWYIRTKVTLTGAEGVSGLFRNNGKKISWKVTTTSIAVGDEGTETAKPIELATGEQHEILFVYNFNRDVSVYVRKSGATEWTKTHETVATVAAAGLDDLVLTETAGNVDELQIYSGDLFRVTNMTIGGGNFRLSGEYQSGTSDSLYKRNLAVIAVAYDKTYGYTSFASAKEYEAEGGVMLHIAETFPAAGISTGTDDLGAMIWDSVEGGLALADGAGVMAANLATGKPETNQAAGLTTMERYNGVRITGYTGGANILVTASLIDANGVFRGAIQTRANADGMVDTEVAVDPALPNGVYTLMTQYGSTQPVIRQVNLYGEEIPYNSINTISDMKSFLANYGSETVKAWNQEETFAADVLARFNEIKGSTSSFANLYEFREVMDEATDGEVRERELCKAVNEAAKVEKWAEIQRLLMETYAEDLGITEADIAGISSKKNLFLRMGGDYKSAEEVLAGFRAAVAAQRLAESQSGIIGGGTAGGGGAAGGGAVGGGGGIVGSNNANNNAFSNVEVEAGLVTGTDVTPQVEGGIEFTDLDSVPWAEESIKKLQTMHIVSGDGDGTFAPNRAVTREEFLKMAMQAAGIQANADASLTFSDVVAGEWYYSYVAAAFEAGIIKGMSEEYFGIGQQITRSDMAVILKRILDYKGITLTEIKAAFVFDDFDTIPNYARESIALLSEAGLMNGVGNNTFMGAASATRAESAVAILRIYNYIEERR